MGCRFHERAARLRAEDGDVSFSRAEPAPGTETGLCSETASLKWACVHICGLCSIQAQSILHRRCFLLPQLQSGLESTMSSGFSYHCSEAQTCQLSGGRRSAELPGRKIGEAWVSDTDSDTDCNMATSMSLAVVTYCNTNAV